VKWCRAGAEEEHLLFFEVGVFINVWNIASPQRLRDAEFREETRPNDGWWDASEMFKKAEMIGQGEAWVQRTVETVATWSYKSRRECVFSRAPAVHALLVSRFRYVL
jgi:hypothetical protein